MVVWLSHGTRNLYWRLEDYQDPWPQIGKPETRQRLRGGNDWSDDSAGDGSLWHARLHDAFNYHGHHGGWLRQEFWGTRLGHYRAHLVGLDYDHSGRRRNCLRAGAPGGRLGDALIQA